MSNDNIDDAGSFSAWQAATPMRAGEGGGRGGVRGAVARRALVVDDNRDGADSLGMLLELLGVKIRVVYDGEAALAALNEFEAQIAFLDIAMPHLDGYEVAREIRARFPARRMVLVAMTGWSASALDEKNGLAHFDAHLQKPVSTAALTALLNALPEE